MPRASAALRALTALVLLASTAVGGGAAACIRGGAAGAADAMHAHHAMAHGSMHHHPAPRPAPGAPVPRHDGDGCPAMAMNGGSCLGAAAAVRAAPAVLLAAAIAGDLPADGVRDRLPPDAPFHPPRG